MSGAGRNTPLLVIAGIDAVLAVVLLIVGLTMTDLQFVYAAIVLMLLAVVAVIVALALRRN